MYLDTVNVLLVFYCKGLLDGDTAVVSCDQGSVRVLPPNVIP